MKTVSLEIPEELLIHFKSPRKSLEMELKRELALQLYREGYMSFGNARRLSGLTKLDFHELLGNRRIPRQYDLEDFEEDLITIKEIL
jgi:predicted HTH domain antitoxin